jgi:hypothetical protein
VISWIEENVPNVAPPEHDGFGRQFLTRVLPQQNDAEVALDYGANGLKGSLAFPLTLAPVN